MNNKSRQIRSYVLRQGRMSSRQKHGLQHYWPIFGLELQQQPYDFSQVFKREAPLLLEIGFGMGQSLVQMAMACPECNFIGVEVHQPGVGALLSDLADQQLSNVRVFCEDVNKVLNQCIEESSVSRVNIYFPDPWPKKKHHKRRLLQRDFIHVLANTLQTKGFLHFATDWQEYAQFLQELMQDNSSFCPLPEDTALFKELRVMRPQTKFERRGLALGHEVSDLIYQLIG